MAGVQFSVLVFLLATYLSESKELEQSSSVGGMSGGGPGEGLGPRRGEEAGKNALSQVMTEAAFLPGEVAGEQMIGQKVLEIVKNPVNVDLNKLPSDVIEKIAEGGVTTPKTEAKGAVAGQSESGAVVAEERRVEGVTTTVAAEPRTTDVPKESPE